MDWQTHVVLAIKLLKTCRCDEGAAIYSTLPAIDSKPAHFHRLYAHILHNQPKILDSSIEIFTGNNIGVDKESYEYGRIKEMKGEFLELLSDPIIKNKNIKIISSDKISAALSLISHIYFDTFNNPVQAFLPLSSIASGQWKFWDTIGYLDFRNKFYKKESIELFRKKMINSDIWNIKLDGKAMIKAMIVRMGELAEPKISYNVIDDAIAIFFRYLLGPGYKKHISFGKEYEFCIKVESEIEKTIRQCMNLT